MARIMRGGLRLSRIVLTTALSLSLGSCHLAKNTLTYDRAGNLDRQDYRDALAPVPPPAAAATPTPDFQPVVATPEDMRLPAPRVTVSVNQTVSLRDLLFELADQADVDLELDPQIHGSLIFTAKDRPFDEVVERIAAMAGLRYKFADNVLRVELDRPYVKHYNIGYLNVKRSGKSEISTVVTIGSSSGGGGGGSSGGGGGDEGGSSDAGITGSSAGGSSSSIESEYSGDLWKEIDEGLKHLLTATDTDVMLATLSDPMSTPINPMPPMPVDPNAPASDQPPPLPGAPSAGVPQAGAMQPAAAPMLNITPTSEPTVPNAPSTYSISRQTGIVSVFAAERQQRQVGKYLHDFLRRATTQVQIEAKVLQVDLTDEFATGINWGTFNLTGLSRLTPNFSAPAFDPAESVSAFTAIFEPRKNFRATLKALNRFGTVRALSSPRVMALNNQPAVVNVAQSIVYFSITNGTSSTSTGSGTTTTGGLQTQVHSVPQGVLLNVTPSANPDTGEIYLDVRPTVTKLVDFVNDPEPQLLGLPSTVVSKVPQMQTQEMESLLKLQSGQTIVMGGLMQDSSSSQEAGLPVAGDIPIIGNLFKNHGDEIRKSELVIFLTATIVPSTNVDATDRKIYNTFGLDRHPSRM